MKADPRAMPARPALSNNPTWEPVNDHSAATPEAAKDITRMSKPSIMLRTRQIPTTLIWNRLIGDESTVSLTDITSHLCVCRMGITSRDFSYARCGMWVPNAREW